MRRSGPTCGQHNQEILQGILGYDDDRVAELAAAGALD
jgi:crotonobetainyl-CoA:carnitine CoA-transferase CaiB-like acyl-CoA transferase